MSELASHLWLVAVLVAAAAAAASYFVTVALQPVLRSYALAHPNVRSSHKAATPQGGGIAVITSTIVIVVLAELTLADFAAFPRQLAAVFAMTVALAVIGATDDVRPLEALPRLVLQTIAVMVVVAALPPELRVLSFLPWWVERAFLVLGIVWFVNLVNFMDGIDWMTVAEVVPITTALALFGLMAALPRDATLVAFALGGATIGFAPFNRPIAKLFLGDVGSLPIGLLLAWLLLKLAGDGHSTAALLLPLYYLADATITLLRRLVQGEPVMKAHRSHFYQRAVDRGGSVYQIIVRVFAVNVLLAGLAAATVLSSSWMLHVACLALGSTFVGALLWTFKRSP